MPERVRKYISDIDVTALSPSEKLSTVFEEHLLEMTGCSHCKIAEGFNNCNQLGLKDARTLSQAVIELLELKRDIQLNAGRVIASGVELSVSDELIDMWRERMIARHPDLGGVLADSVAVQACINCPGKLDYNAQVSVEYTPDN